MSKGQGIVEYALILVLIAVVVIAVLALLAPAVGNIMHPTPCGSDPKSFECKNLLVEQCLASEQYTKDQCVILIGGSK